MNIINTHCVQSVLPLQFVFERIETRAFPFLSCDKQAFASVGRELVNARLDIMQFFLAPLELRLGSRAAMIYVCRDPRKGCQTQRLDTCSVRDGCPGLGAHLQMIGVSVRARLTTMH